MSISIVETNSAEETRSFGQQLAALLQPGDVVLLHGDLGAGKTTLAQGIAAGLGARRSMQSPTFSLVVDTSLDNDLILRHIDLYRLDDPGDLDTLGFEDLTNDERVITLVEWPERAVGMLPDAYVLIELESVGPDRRAITIRPIGLGSRWEQWNIR